VLCSALSMMTAACSHNPHDGSGKTALDCLHRDREVCQLVTAIQPANSGSGMSRASQIELDVEAILDGMHAPRRSPQNPPHPVQIE
jgi:hypothetical protein